MYFAFFLFNIIELVGTDLAPSLTRPSKDKEMIK